MSDHADKSDARIEQVVEQGINQVRRSPRLHSDGRCHFCEESVPDGMLFCDVDCRDDYERQRSALARAGR